MPIAKAEFTTRFFTEADISRGMRVLDVGCGSGDLSFFIASLVGQEGAVVGVDRDLSALSMPPQSASSEQVPPPSFIESDLMSLPPDLGQFDAIVGRRVLMYQPDTVAAVRALSNSLKPGGLAVFQEHDSTLVPVSLGAFPLHRQAQAWIKEMLVLEGADLHIGLHLQKILSAAGLHVDAVKAECLLQLPDQPNSLGDIIKSCLPRIINLGIASAEAVDMPTLQYRLNSERAQSDDIYIGDIIFGARARKPF